MTAHANSRTHCQVAQADPLTKTWRQRVSVPTHNHNDRQSNGREKSF
jgi:hypothetical protein